MKQCSNPFCENYSKDADSCCSQTCSEHLYDIRNGLGEYNNKKIIVESGKGIEVLNHRNSEE